MLRRRALGQRVSAQLLQLGPHTSYAHAGRDYVEYLVGVTLVNVLDDLVLGQRLLRYDEQAAKEGWICP